ncbi:MAG TPA: glycerate kinase [Virgibacillus sp.]|nr:glycerate kinase [Virgibacillus sp.]
MKIVIAPDSFKESMSALEAANAIERGFKKVFPEAAYIKVPMADGGEGTVQSLVDATEGTIMTTVVTGPLGTPVKAFYGLSGDKQTAVIEMAAASGLHLVPIAERNPLLTTTKGTGELILAALNQGVKHIIIGIGGSATNDGGAGMAQALGAQLLTREGKEIGFGGGALRDLAEIDPSLIDARLKDISIHVACDVNNQLTGKEGASAVFGPQKGATEEVIMELDQNLAHYASLLEDQLGIKIDNIPGAGAAGGLGGGLFAFLGAELKRGVDIVMDTVQLEKQLENASLVITGEGRIDVQTIYGKTPIGVAKRAKKSSIPVIGIAGSLGQGCEVVYEHGIDALFSITPSPVLLADALAYAEVYTEQVSENIAKTMKIAERLLG